jgi:hypothetical protein
VTATARTASSVKELAGIFAASGEKIVVEQVDIDLPDSVDSLATRVGDRRFDLVFINAGVAGPEHQSVDAATPQEIGALMYTNAVAPIRIARRLLPWLPDRPCRAGDGGSCKDGNAPGAMAGTQQRKVAGAGTEYRGAARRIDPPRPGAFELRPQRVTRKLGRDRLPAQADLRRPARANPVATRIAMATRSVKRPAARRLRACCY